MIADGSLGELAYLNVAIAKDGVVKGPALGKELKHTACIDNITFAGRLYQRLIGHRILAKHQRRSDHPFETGKPDLDGSPVLRFGKQGDHSVVRKKTPLERIARESDEMADRKRNEFEMRLDESSFIRRQYLKKPISRRFSR